MAKTWSRADLVSRIADLRQKLLGRDDVAALAAVSAAEVAGYMREVEASANAMVRQHRLERAGRLATRLGLTQEARAIASQLQAIRPGDLAMQTITESSKLPRWVPEAYIARFTRGEDWRSGVLEFLTLTEVPSGSVGRLQAHAAEARGGLSQLFGVTLLGGDGIPRATLSTPEEKDRHEMAFAGRIAAEYFGDLMAEGLFRIRDKYGAPELEDLTDLIIGAGAADPRLARSLARGLRHFWAGESEAALGVVITKIEASARGLLKELDEGIYKVQVGKDPGGYPGLYVLLTELEKLALDEDWAWFLRWLLLGPSGANLRNEVSHGFVTDLPPNYVALVLRAAALLITATPVSTDLDRCVETRRPPRTEPPLREGAGPRIGRDLLRRAGRSRHHCRGPGTTPSANYLNH